jgi:predicted nicotinamide N-methyase
MTSHKFSDDNRLPQIPGGWRHESIDLGKRTFHLAVPVDPDLLLDLPETLVEHQADDYMPYWAWLWPAATDMAKWVISQQWQTDTEALELGCGMGLVGMAAAAAGLNVTLSDYRSEAVAVAETNLHRNGLTAPVEQIDWRKPPLRQWPVILACDVLYEVPNHAAILEFAANALEPAGACWIGDPGRMNTDLFLKTVRDDGRLVATDENGLPISDIRIGQFKVLRLHRMAA